MNVDKAIKSSAEELRSLLRDADKFLARSSDAADGKVRELRDRMRGALHDGHDRFDSVRDAAREHLDECGTYVREHPLQAVGVAILLGAAAAILLGRRD